MKISGFVRGAVGQALGAVAFATIAWGVPGDDVWDEMAATIAGVEGSVDVVFGIEPFARDYGQLASVLLQSNAKPVRFSATGGAGDSEALASAVREFSEAQGKEWLYCEKWWSDDEGGKAARIRDNFGGSMIFIDTGITSDIVDNPEADFSTAMENDPVFVDIFSEDARRLTSPQEYFDAVSLIWGQVVPRASLEIDRQERGGWMDGC